MNYGIIWTEHLTLWIWITSTVAVCRPAVPIDIKPRIFPSPVRDTSCPLSCLSIILPQYEVLQTKQGT